RRVGRYGPQSAHSMQERHKYLEGRFESNMSAGNGNPDAVIIGGGPAGVSCAVWLARLGLTPMLVEAGNAVGGLCRHNRYLDEWTASLPGMSGPKVADILALSLEQAAVATRLSSRAEHIAPQPEGFAVSGPAFAEPLRTRHVVLATGV